MITSKIDDDDDDDCDNGLVIMFNEEQKWYF